MDSICKFIPSKSIGDLKTVHFVYETEFKKLKQPFVRPIYYMYLVTRGSGNLKILSNTSEIRVGSLFFSFPGIPIEIAGSDDLTYTYISFMGSRAVNIISDLKITPSNPVVHGFESEISFWKSAIQRINQNNANMLTESVLLYTLSFLSFDGVEAKKKTHNIIENILMYLDNNYTDPDMSLKKVADIFAYTDKYLSHIFKEYMNMNFSKYLTSLRIQRATELMGEGMHDVSVLATECGFRDPGYFSKVFKTMIHKTPLEYISFLSSKSSEPSNTTDS